METKTYTTLERKDWGSGPWDSEPDKVQWPDAATGLPCLAVRNPFMGHWCGYVGVAEGHPLFGKDYGATGELRAHGGVNFANECQPGEREADGICHVPAPDEPAQVWWFGFDCAHSDDLSPGTHAALASLGSQHLLKWQKYRPLSYVQAECARLAAQLAKLS